MRKRSSKAYDVKNKAFILKRSTAMNWANSYVSIKTISIPTTFSPFLALMNAMVVSQSNLTSPSIFQYSERKIEMTERGLNN
jgi:hypothetical protein